MVDYHGKKIVIIGLGLTGISCVNFFLMQGITPRVMDTRFNPPELDKLPKQVERYLGGFKNDWLLKADLIVLSPGIKLSHPFLRSILSIGIEIIGDIELFCREAKVSIVAITGSNGKSTVAKLVEILAQASGINVGLGGNIGIPALNLLYSSYELYVLELSSFQLEVTTSLQAIVATILNITEDHMDSYPFGFQQYYAAKLRIYENAKNILVNANDVLTIPKKNLNNTYLSFGVNIGDYHLSQYRNDTWICLRGEKLLNTKKMKIFGQHNYVNALAALAISDIIGLPRISSLKALANFSGLAHRFQLSLDRNNVRWINDSKSTNIGSTKAVISSLHIKGTLHLLLGGYSKSANFSLLRPYLIRDNICIYCFGCDSSKLLSELHLEFYERTETLEQAMYLISSRVKPGDVVLLSPACASFDQFKNFEHRGDVFTRLAIELG